MTFSTESELSVENASSPTSGITSRAPLGVRAGDAVRTSSIKTVFEVSRTPSRRPTKTIVRNSVVRPIPFAHRAPFVAARRRPRSSPAVVVVRRRRSSSVIRADGRSTRAREAASTGTSPTRDDDADDAPSASRARESRDDDDDDEDDDDDDDDDARASERAWMMANGRFGMSREAREARARAREDDDARESVSEDRARRDYDATATGEWAREREDEESAREDEFAELVAKEDAFSDARKIFAMWNVMVGSSVLTTPWAFTESGLVLGSVLAVSMGMIMAYTSSLMLRYGAERGHDDLASIAGARLGRAAARLCNVFMVAMMLQTMIVYCMMMSTSVYGVVKGLADLVSHQQSSRDFAMENDFLCWTPVTAIFITAGILLVLGSFNNMEFFVGMSALGPFFMTYLIIFMVFKSVVAEKPVLPIAPFAAWATARKTAGVLANCLFSHHAVNPVFRSHSKRNLRNLFIAYFLTIFSYLLPAIAGNFSAEYVAVRQGDDGSSKASNFLSVFPPSDYYTLSAHAALTVRFIATVPLLLFILRTHVASLLPSVHVEAEWLCNLGVNIVAICVGCVCAAHPAIDIGIVLSRSGGVFGYIFAFALPVAVHLTSSDRSALGDVAHGFIVAFGLTVAASQLAP